ncbi:MAG: CPBP family intramembrane metalloprotease [Candidatus Krumholzibacteria bacterium]|nr:CPBP family intramembrane metalloprotease [Candidatus Krumholzibacteria bacterium]
MILGGFRIVPGAASMGQYVILAVMWVPGLAAVLTIKLVTHEGFRIAGLRFGSWRPYATAALIIPACFLVIYSLTWLMGLGRADWKFASFLDQIAKQSTAGMPPMPSPYLVWPAIFFATLVVAPFFNGLFGLGEELGWRGYLLPKLMPLGKPRAYALLGLIWGLWHLPLVLVGFTYPGHPLPGALMFIGLTSTFGIYLNELTLRHRSSIIAGWAHGVFNSQKLGAWALLFPGVNPLLGGYAGLLGIGVWLALGLFEVRRGRKESMNENVQEA